MHYIYILLDPQQKGSFQYENFLFEFLPFYIGQGYNDRIHRTTRINGSTGLKRSKLIQIKNANLKPIAIKLFENLTYEEANEKEAYLVKLIGRKLYNEGPLTNVLPGGNGSDVTEERNHFFNKKHTEDIKENHSKLISGTNHPMFGKKHDDKTKIKLKEASDKGREKNNEFCKKSFSKIVLQYDIDMNFIQEFSSVKEASEKLGFSESKISKCCRGLRRPKEFIFRYKEGVILKNSFIIKINDKFISKFLNEELTLIQRTNVTAICLNNNNEHINIRIKEEPEIWNKNTLKEILDKNNINTESVDLFLKGYNKSNNFIYLQDLYNEYCKITKIPLSKRKFVLVLIDNGIKIDNNHYKTSKFIFLEKI